jgi:C4-dicarboxylate transporter, DctQ subunit
LCAALHDGDDQVSDHKPQDPRAPLSETRKGQVAAGQEGAAPRSPALSEDAAPTAYRSDLPGPLGWVDVGVARLEAFVLSAGVLLMAGNTVANVIGRFVFGSSIQTTEEVNRILIILITFAGISYAARHGRHIRMTAFFDMLPTRPRKVLMIVISLVTAAAMFALAWYAWGYMMTQMSRGRLLPSLQIPVWWTLVWVPVGLFMTGLQYLLTAIRNIVSSDIYLSTSVLEGYADDTEREV